MHRCSSFLHHMLICIQTDIWLFLVLTEEPPIPTVLIIQDKWVWEAFERDFFWFCFFNWNVWVCAWSCVCFWNCVVVIVCCFSDVEGGGCEDSEAVRDQQPARVLQDLQSEVVWCVETLSEGTEGSVPYVGMRVWMHLNNYLSIIQI